MPPEWKVEPYVEADGGQPIEEFILQLNSAEQGRLRKRIKYLKMYSLNASTDVLHKVFGGKSKTQGEILGGSCGSWS